MLRAFGWEPRRRWTTRTPAGPPRQGRPLTRRFDWALGLQAGQPGDALLAANNNFLRRLEKLECLSLIRSAGQNHTRRRRQNKRRELVSSAALKKKNRMGKQSQRASRRATATTRRARRRRGRRTRSSSWPTRSPRPSTPSSSRQVHAGGLFFGLGLVAAHAARPAGASGRRPAPGASATGPFLGGGPRGPRRGGARRGPERRRERQSHPCIARGDPRLAPPARAGAGGRGLRRRAQPRPRSGARRAWPWRPEARRRAPAAAAAGRRGRARRAPRGRGGGFAYAAAVYALPARRARPRPRPCSAAARRRRRGVRVAGRGRRGAAAPRARGGGRGRGRRRGAGGLRVLPRVGRGALGRRGPCGNQGHGAFVLTRRVVLHAIDAAPARRRGAAGSSPLDRARAAAPSPLLHDLVKNCRVHPAPMLTSTQVAVAELDPDPAGRRRHGGLPGVAQAAGRQRAARPYLGSAFDVGRAPAARRRRGPRTEDAWHRRNAAADWAGERVPLQQV